MNLFVTNISRKANEESLRELFAQHGTVNAVKIINDRHSGESKGFGFVEMNDDQEAQNAINRLASADFFGKSLVVEKARPRTTNPAGASY